MTEIRTKDKLFLVAIVPAAVAALYWFGWRADAGRRIDALRQRQAALVEKEDFDDEMLKARRQAAAARDDLAAERSIPNPEVKVRGAATETEAERSQAVVETFRSFGIKVARSVVSEAKPAAVDVLRATGVRPSPVVRVWTLDGAYPALQAALDAFDADERAMVPVSVSVAPPSRIVVTAAF